jgi:hypothetical protein
MLKKRKNLDLVLNCSVCSSVFDDQQILLIGERENGTIFHATCQKCLTSALIFLSQTEQGMMSVGMVTDLNGNEVRDMFGRKAIDADDVLEIYRVTHNKKLFLGN